MRIDPNKTQKEPTYQVVLDTLALSPYYLAFLITSDVLEIYMQQFWFTISKIKESSSYQFKLDKKRCLSGKDTSLDKIRLSRAQILCEMFYSKNVDFVDLLWEDFMFQIDNKESSAKRQENMPYPRLTKAIIQHFIFRDKSISMRNGLFMHTVKHDNILGSLKLVSKTKEYQVYGALIPIGMTNMKMLNSTAYKTYLAFAIGATTPKKARKFKKLASPSKKKTLVAIEEPAKKHVIDIK
ncbi:hypothetical protein Tco_1155693 [Tanacetum coccineum]